MMRDRVAVGEGSLFKSARKHAYESVLKKSAMFPVLFHHHTSSVRISRTHCQAECSGRKKTELSTVK